MKENKNKTDFECRHKIGKGSWWTSPDSWDKGGVETATRI